MFTFLSLLFAIKKWVKHSCQANTLCKKWVTTLSGVGVNNSMYNFPIATPLLTYQLHFLEIQTWPLNMMNSALLVALFRCNGASLASYHILRSGILVAGHTSLLTSGGRNERGALGPPRFVNVVRRRGWKFHGGSGRQGGWSGRRGRRRTQWNVVNLLQFFFGGVAASIHIGGCIVLTRRNKESGRGQGLVFYDGFITAATTTACLLVVAAAQLVHGWHAWWAWHQVTLVIGEVHGICKVDVF